MEIRGIKFSPVAQAAGVTNFFGQGYWFHSLLKLIGVRLKHTTFVSKTTNLLGRVGNMPLKEDRVTPQELFPKCIIVDRENELGLNAVGLSGPGIEFLMDDGRWQTRTDSFFISIMSLASSADLRLGESVEMFRIISCRKHEFRGNVGIQQNLSCPNGGLDPASMIEEAMPLLEKAERHLHPAIPYLMKFGPDLHPEAAKKIAAHPRCDGLVVFNTLPFGKHPIWAKKTQPVDWKRLFGTSVPKESPLAKLFPGSAGGLSGAPLRPFLFEWLEMARGLGIRTHIQAGGGLLRPQDIDDVKKAGADSVAAVGSNMFIKPFEAPDVITHALNLNWR